MTLNTIIILLKTIEKNPWQIITIARNRVLCQQLHRFISCHEFHFLVARVLKSLFGKSLAVVIMWHRSSQFKHHIQNWSWRLISCKLNKVLENSRTDGILHVHDKGEWWQNKSSLLTRSRTIKDGELDRIAFHGSLQKHFEVRSYCTW